MLFSLPGQSCGAAAFAGAVSSHWGRLGIPQSLSGLEGASNTLTVDVLQGSQVAPGVVNVHVDTADM